VISPCYTYRRSARFNSSELDTGRAFPVPPSRQEKDWQTREQMEAVTAGTGASGIPDQGLPATGLTALHLETYEVTMHA
jgi:hypothetical protein